MSDDVTLDAVEIDHSEFTFSGRTTPEYDDPDPKRAPTCEICSKELRYGGRGRKPRFCDEHKPSRSTPTGARKRNASLETLRKDLQSTLAATGMGITMLNAFDGMVIVSKSEPLSDALIGLAEKDPKFRRALEAAMRSGSYLQLAMVCVSIAVPIMWNHGVIQGVKERDENGRVHVSRNNDLMPLMFNMGGLGHMLEKTDKPSDETASE